MDVEKCSTVKEKECAPVKREECKNILEEVCNQVVAKINYTGGLTSALLHSVSYCHLPVVL